MSESSDREYLSYRAAQREPVFFGLQYFVILVGVVALARYLDGALFDGANSGIDGRQVMTAALGAVLFTLFMRWMGRRKSGRPRYRAGGLSTTLSILQTPEPPARAASPGSSASAY